ncbi:glycosyltransferase family 4 protein [Bacillus sp. 1P10SD]|uniref:glycosyltransferase family 4 protein n=1 Tax=Bacillus sp. 1P10SD TaxID=3132265 RepID=UPI0039A4B8D0
MVKKILFAATVDYHFQAFHLPYLKWFKEQGWEVHVAASGTMNLPFVDRKFTIPIQRSPFNKQNVKAYLQLKKIISQEKYQIIHCHTPMGGVLTRLAAINARNQGTKVLYTAHGFHFCKGAPIQNWMFYYPIEKLLSRFTDCLITINQEDYDLAQKHHFKAGTIQHVHGVGVNTDVFKPVDEIQKQKLKNKHGYHHDHFIMFYAAEFNKNKNQKFLIESLASIKHSVPKAKILLAGDGALLKECQELAETLGVKQMVDFLGYRTDIQELLKISDIAVASSLREGLPVNIMEAMACGLPIVAIANRGHRELVIHNQNGWLIEKTNTIDFSNKMKILSEDQNLRSQFGLNGRNLTLEKYSLQKVLQEKKEIYSLYIDGTEELLWAAH